MIVAPSRVVVIAMLAGCGRIAFDPVTLDGGSPCVAPPPGCPTATVYECNGQCFALCEQLTARAVAATMCADWGGCVATIPDEGTNTCVASRLTSANTWIGLTQETPASALDTGWSWCDGTALSFENWEPDEPNDNADAIETGEEQCAMMKPSAEWADQSCVSSHVAVCSRPL